MSGPLKLSPAQVTALGDFMQAISKATRDTAVYLAPFGGEQLQVGDTAIAFRWDAESTQYVLDDRVGL